jgi:hypothetical protein
MTTRRSGPRRVVARAAVLAVAVALAVVVGACGTTTASPQPAATPGATAPPRALGPASAATRTALFAALGDAGILVADSPLPYRPAESLALAAAPRTVYQVTLQSDPEPSYVVVYELESEAAATAAAKEMHAYLTSGPGKVNTPLGTQHVLQQRGPTVLYYQWLPAAAVDPAAPRVAEALRTIGTTFEVRD